MVDFLIHIVIAMQLRFKLSGGIFYVKEENYLFNNTTVYTATTIRVVYCGFWVTRRTTKTSKSCCSALSTTSGNTIMSTHKNHEPMVKGVYI